MNIMVFVYYWKYYEVFWIDFRCCRKCFKILYIFVSNIFSFKWNKNKNI